MGKSQRLRLRDLRAIYRLVGECREMGAEVVRWLPHLMEESRRLVGGTVVTGGQVRGWADNKPEGLLILDFGWDDPTGHEVFDRWLREGDLESDVFYSRICRMRRPILTRHRRQLVRDDEWYRSPIYNNYIRFGRTDDYLISCYTMPDCDLVQSLAVHRAQNDPPFGSREVRLLHWLHHEVGISLEKQLTTARQSSLPNLPRRLQQTLMCLLEGDSEKQVAKRLGLSSQTVHGYVKALYRHFGVNSRAELMALWIRLSKSPKQL